MVLLREDLEKRYIAGQSMSAIAEELNCSVNKIVYWMDRYGIKRRSWSEASYIKANPTGDPFKINPSLNESQLKLKGLGLGIYWGEGNKVSLHTVRVANTDSELIKTFMIFLKEICGVQKEKMTFSLVCFNDSIVETVSEYWSKELGILPEKFGKIVQIPPQGKGLYKRKSEYGVCTITVSNVKLKKWVMEELSTLKAEFAGVAQW